MPLMKAKNRSIRESPEGAGMAPNAIAEEDPPQMPAHAAHTDAALDDDRLEDDAQAPLVHCFTLRSDGSNMPAVRA